jgi:hypothetical protein
MAKKDKLEPGEPLDIVPRDEDLSRKPKVREFCLELYEGVEKGYQDQVNPAHLGPPSIEALFLREAATYVADDLRPASSANRGPLKPRGDLAGMPLDLAHTGCDVVERVYLPKLKLG